jgi:hypothetical protein
MTLSSVTTYKTQRSIMLLVIVLSTVMPGVSFFYCCSDCCQADCG